VAYNQLIAGLPPMGVTHRGVQVIPAGPTFGTFSFSQLKSLYRGRKYMGYIDDIIHAFEQLNGIAHYSDLYEQIQKNATRPLPSSWQAIIRARIEERSSDSKAFLGNDDLFFSVEGLGEGYWGLRSYIKPEPIAPDASDPNLPARNNVEISRIIRDTRIARQMKLLYQNRCQICGKTISLKNQTYSEAHHIKPLGQPHNGLDQTDNILVLCPNHHVEFDYGSIAINPETYEIMHINKNSEYIGKQILLAKNHIIEKSNLEYHMKYIYNKVPK
jgi:hypothetical protein